MTTHHTPGPWTASDNAIYGSSGLIKPLVAHLDDRFADDEAANNARLIAAAPDLLAALREIVAAVEVGEVDGYSPSGDWFREAKAALAKATGAA